MTTTQNAPTQPPLAVQKNGAALASLILGIVSLVANVLLIPTVLGVIFGIIGLTRAERSGRRGLAIGGILMSIGGAIIGIAVFIVAFTFITTAAKTAAITVPSIERSAGAGSDGSAGDDGTSGGSGAAPADLPAGYKAVTRDVWFKWGKTDTSSELITEKGATVIAPNGCHSLLVEANEYDKSGTNVGLTVASATNLAAGDKAKLTFSWPPDDHVDTVRISEATCF